MSDSTFANLAQFNFGEKLVELVLTTLSNNDTSITHYEIDVEKKCWNKCTDKNPFQNLKFLAERELRVRPVGVNSNEGFSPNGMSKIDVLAYDNIKGVAIEVKLGQTRGASNFPKSFLDIWKDGNYLTENLSKEKIGTGKFNGNMIHILDSDRSFNKGTKFNFFTRLENITEVLEIEENWWLVLRESCFPKENSVLNQVNKDNFSFQRLKRVFVFEDLWKCLSEIERSTIQNELMDLLKKEFITLNEHCKLK